MAMLLSRYKRKRTSKTFQIFDQNSNQNNFDSFLMGTLFCVTSINIIFDEYREKKTSKVYYLRFSLYFVLKIFEIKYKSYFFRGLTVERK